ncbi:zinc-binding dehydrogenase [Streptacidiphilus griseoplanus]|uniref:zinc-binding dehydrogenase n=1 Tax=Peterkaempfera griseoplana TaxID=66896 RepID=UPI0006E19E0B|nr:zinc-binding dehydrogenase [Peterkaempfera griseoplana]
MRAIVLRQYGGPEELRLEEVPEPVAGPGEVVVGVDAAGIQFVETQIRSGSMQGASPVAPTMLPWTPGREVAGVVESVGAGVDRQLVGRRVAGQTATGGGYAERAVLAVDGLHLLPETLGSAEAVSLLGTGRTAVALVETAGIGEGDIVLVESAAGAVGTLVLQLARAAGAGMLIALAGGEAKLGLAREFGADAAIDYTEPDWPEQVRRVAPDGVTVVLDAVGGPTGLSAFELLAPGGRFVIYGASSGSVTRLDPAAAAERGVTVSSYVGPPTGHRAPAVQLRQTREALVAAAEGRLRPVVGQRFPLAEASAAHAAITSRATVGKTVLLP